LYWRALALVITGNTSLTVDGAASAHEEANLIAPRANTINTRSPA